MAQSACRRDAPYAAADVTVIEGLGVLDGGQPSPEPRIADGNEVAASRDDDAIGDEASWRRDFGWIGFFSSLLAPIAIVQEELGVIAGVMMGLIGAASGRWFGKKLRGALLGPYRRVPIWHLLITMPIAGAFWGAFVGAAGAFLIFPLAAPIGAILAAPCAALQVGWAWLPYTVLRLRGQSGWPIVAACTVTPLLGGWAFHELVGNFSLLDV